MCYAEPLLFHALYYLPHSFPVLFLLASKSMFIVLLNKRKGWCNSPWPGVSRWHNINTADTDSALAVG